MVTPFLLNYDGNYFNGPDGVEYVGGRKKVIKVQHPVTYDVLCGAIRRKIGFGRNEYISKLLYRLPVIFGPPIHYTSMEVCDDDDVCTMINSLRDVPGLKYLTLYVEKGTNATPQNEYTIMDELVVSSTYDTEFLSTMQYNLSGVGTSRVNEFDINSIPENEPDDDYHVPRLHDPEILLPIPYHENETVETPYQNPNFDSTDDEVEPHLDDDEDDDSQPLVVYDEGWVVNNQTGARDADLNEDMIWATKVDMIQAVKRYSMKVSCDYHVKESKKHCWSARCLLADGGCNWYFRASIKKGFWTVAKFKFPHTCFAERVSEDHRQLDSKFIARYIRRRVENQPTIPVISIITEVQDNLKFKPSYKKAWDGKQKAIAMIWGGWKESYNMLPKWFAACQAANPGTVVEWEYQYCYTGTNVRLPQGTRIFKRVFWAFKPCIDAFKKCIPVLLIDGTFLYGKYKQTLLIATAVDGNNAIIPIAFALVESENIDSWPWFLLQIRLHVTPPSGICIISDRHDGIKKAMTTDVCGWGESSGAVWRFCLRHVASNYNNKFKCPQIKNLMKAAGYKAQKRKLDRHLNRIKEAHLESHQWIENLTKEKWSLAYDGGYRYGHMTTNIVECVNKVFKKVRHLPITALVTETFDKLRDYFRQRRIACSQELAAGVMYSEMLNTSLRRWMDKARGHNVRVFRPEEGICQVTTGWDAVWQKGQHDFKVKLFAGKCQCGKFQALHYPCSHAIACCIALRLDHRLFIDKRYTMENTRDCYESLFNPLGNEDYWPPYEDFDVTLLPDGTLLRQKGHPTKRIQNEMDETPRRVVCSLCKNEGHSATHCTNVESLGRTSGRTRRGH